MPRRIAAPIWANSIARELELANIFLRVPVGFKSETSASQGSTHIIEHLIVTGTLSEGLHFNGFTSDSSSAVYAMCRSDSIDSLVHEMARRLDSRTITQGRVDVEVAAIRAETHGRNPVPERLRRALGDLGFNPMDGRPTGHISIESVIQRAEIMSAEAQCWVFSSDTPTPRLVFGTAEPPRVSKQVRHTRRHDAGGVTVGWTFDSNSLNHIERHELAATLCVADAFLRHRGGYAMAGFLDDWHLWAGDQWIVTHLPLSVARTVRAHTDGTLAGLARRIGSASTTAARSIESQLWAGPNWLHPPLVRGMVGATVPKSHQETAHSAADAASEHRGVSGVRIV